MFSNKIRSVTACAAAAVAAIAGSATIPTIASANERGVPAWCSSKGELRAEDLPETLPPHAGCDLTGRSIRSGSIVLQVQRPGMGVRLDGVGATHVDFALTTLPDGTVVVGRDKDAEGEEALPPGANNPLNPDPCAAATASAYSYLGHKAYSSIGWYYNGSGAPSSVATTALNAIYNGASAMADGHDSCGISTIPRDSYHSYQGGTATGSTASASSCGSYDGVSVVGWGALGASGPLAVACSWSYTDVSPHRWASSDIKFNNNYSWTTDVLTCIGAGSVGAYDVKSIATHEWGHAFGMGHVSESSPTSSQTMSTNSDGTCQDNEATLGRGDLNGMIALYGAL